MVYFLTQIFLVKLQYKVKEDWKNGSIPAKTIDRERSTLGGADVRYDQQPNSPLITIGDLMVVETQGVMLINCTEVFFVQQQQDVSNVRPHDRLFIILGHSEETLYSSF